jgi:hypothetical protein
MKSAVLSLAVVLTCSFFSASSQASEGEYYERGGERYEHGERYSDDGRGYYGRGYEESKFYGAVEAMPQGGVLGTWRIGGRDVVVTERTFIKQEYGPLGLGAQVEVKGGGNPIMAYELEVKSRGRAMTGPAPATPPPAMGGMKFYGAIEAMPQGGMLLGTWRIGGRDVIVTQRTLLKQQYGPFAPGAQVEVKGGGAPFTAYEIEVKGMGIR